MSLFKFKQLIRAFQTEELSTKDVQLKQLNMEEYSLINFTYLISFEDTCFIFNLVNLILFYKYVEFGRSRIFKNDQSKGLAVNETRNRGRSLL